MMPSVMPVQSVTPRIVQPSQSPNPGMNTTQPVAGSQTASRSSVDAVIASMASTNERLMSQLQTEYMQKLNDYGNQNRAIQEQMTALNNRVAGLETQLNQLVQALTHSNQGVAPAPIPAAAPPIGPSTHTSEVKIDFTVQAIIPGRAWLKSESGETVTVAEGDTIRDLGRVTKIDPYDGIVEVNTGSKVIALSYGSGG
jgi:hypothetical protein